MLFCRTFYLSSLLACMTPRSIYPPFLPATIFPAYHDHDLDVLYRYIISSLFPFQPPLLGMDCSLFAYVAYSSFICFNVHSLELVMSNTTLKSCDSVDVLRNLCCSINSKHIY